MSLVGIEDAVGEPVGAKVLPDTGAGARHTSGVEGPVSHRARLSGVAGKEPGRASNSTRDAKVRHQPEACNRKKMARPSKTAKRG
jgi:hypothetical protein